MLPPWVQNKINLKDCLQKATLTYFGFALKIYALLDIGKGHHSAFVVVAAGRNQKRAQLTSLKTEIKYRHMVLLYRHRQPINKNNSANKSKT